MSKLPPILTHIVEESKHPLTEREIAAGAKYFHGGGTLGDMIEARRAARQSAPRR